MECLLSACYGYLPLLLLILIITPLFVLLAKRQQRKLDSLYQKSLQNQETMIELLRQIRDSLKK